MKTSCRYEKNAAQDLLNAVVVQAAVDYREYSVRMMVNPDDWYAGKELEEVKSFFLSPRFGWYTTVSGQFILRELAAEQQKVRDDYSKWLGDKALLEKEEQKLAKLLLQWEITGSVDIRQQGSMQEEKVESLLKDLEKKRQAFPLTIRRYLPILKQEVEIEKAYCQLQEELSNGEEKLCG